MGHPVLMNCALSLPGGRHAAAEPRGGDASGLPRHRGHLLRLGGVLPRELGVAVPRQALPQQEHRLHPQVVVSGREVKLLRGHLQMTLARFLEFLTPPRQHFEPIYSTEITQPPLLHQNLGTLLSPSLLTSFVNGP